MIQPVRHASLLFAMAALAACAPPPGATAPPAVASPSVPGPAAPAAAMATPPAAAGPGGSGGGAFGSGLGGGAATGMSGIGTPATATASGAGAEPAGGTTTGADAVPPLPDRPAFREWEDVTTLTAPLKRADRVRLSPWGRHSAFEGGAVYALDEEGNFSYLAGRVQPPGDKFKAVAEGEGPYAIIPTIADLVAAESGTVYVACAEANRVLQVTRSGRMRSLAGAVLGAGTADGTGEAAKLDNPIRLAIGEAGVLYVLEYATSSLLVDGVVNTKRYAVRRITPGGEVTTVYRNLAPTWERDSLVTFGLDADEVPYVMLRGGKVVRIDAAGEAPPFMVPNDGGEVWQLRFVGSDVVYATQQGLYRMAQGAGADAAPERLLASRGGPLDGALEAATFGRFMDFAFQDRETVVVVDQATEGATTNLVRRVRLDGGRGKRGATPDRGTLVPSDAPGDGFELPRQANGSYPGAGRFSFPLIDTTGTIWGYGDLTPGAVWRFSAEGTVTKAFDAEGPVGTDIDLDLADRIVMPRMGTDGGTLVYDQDGSIADDLALPPPGEPAFAAGAGSDRVPGINVAIGEGGALWTLVGGGADEAQGGDAEHLIKVVGRRTSTVDVPLLSAGPHLSTDAFGGACLLSQPGVVTKYDGTGNLVYSRALPLDPAYFYRKLTHDRAGRSYLVGQSSQGTHAHVVYQLDEHGFIRAVRDVVVDDLLPDQEYVEAVTVDHGGTAWAAIRRAGRDGGSAHMQVVKLRPASR